MRASHEPVPSVSSEGEHDVPCLQDIRIADFQALAAGLVQQQCHGIVTAGLDHPGLRRFVFETGSQLIAAFQATARV